jgi:shikimate dehydrogenase
MTKTIGLIGYPVRHSISPYFQQAALDYYNLDVRYDAWEVRPEDLEVTASRLRNLRYLGANVTIPYKESVIPLLDGLDEWATVVGAVNTIVRDNDRLVGFNTDSYGFLKALYQDGNFNPEDKRVVILGAGGAASAVSFALAQKKVNSITVINRTLGRAQRLVDRLEHFIASQAIVSGRSAIKLNALPWQVLSSRETLPYCHLLVNCTAMGTRYGSLEGDFPLGSDVIPEGIMVYDLVYNPPLTPLLQQSQEAGSSILGGLPMLVYQGAASLQLWTGADAPVAFMMGKAKEALQSLP